MKFSFENANESKWKYGHDAPIRNTLIAILWFCDGIF